MENFWNSNSLLFFSVTSGIVALFLALNFWILWKIKKINRKVAVFFLGKKGRDLEKLILEQNENIKEIDKEVQELFDIANKINRLSFQGLHKVGLIRFNPFKEVGGNQSFSVALLDGKNSGVVISSLHTREGTRIYAKPIISGESQNHPLTEEEKKSIKIATPLKNNRV